MQIFQKDELLKYECEYSSNVQYVVKSNYWDVKNVDSTQYFFLKDQVLISKVNVG